MMVLLWAAPAHAQSYGGVLENGEEQGNQVTVSSAGPSSESGNLARTGQDNIVPLIQAGIVLVGGGTMLVFVARRRRLARRITP